MIAINKDCKKTIPQKLNNDTTKQEFQKNIASEKYVGSDRYKVVSKELEQLYHGKCAFCETNITAGAYNHIEHYRAKSIYYWLAYSWDNLLLSCPKCNIKKSNEFKIKNSQRVNYNNENLSELHCKTPTYNSIENPYLLNPEQLSDDELQSHFSFNSTGEIIAKTEEMEYTKNLCDLNRKELVNRRYAILNDFIITYKLSNNKSEVKNTIKELLKNAIENHYEYIAWRLFLLGIIDRLSN